MNTEDLIRSIVELPVFDTHTHLNAPGRPMAARGFSDIAHYFWLSQQLKGVGWQEGEACDARAAEAYFDAFTKTENTSMNWCLRRILQDLYGITIRSPGIFWPRTPASRNAPNHRLTLKRCAGRARSGKRFRTWSPKPAFRTSRGWACSYRTR